MSRPQLCTLYKFRIWIQVLQTPKQVLFPTGSSWQACSPPGPWVERGLPVGWLESLPNHPQACRASESAHSTGGLEAWHMEPVPLNLLGFPVQGESWQGRSFLLLPSQIAANLVALNDANYYVTVLQVGSLTRVSRIKVSSRLCSSLAC